VRRSLLLGVQALLPAAPSAADRAAAGAGAGDRPGGGDGRARSRRGRRAAWAEWDALERAYDAAEKAYDWQGQRAAGARLETLAKALKADWSLDGVLRERGHEMGIAAGSQLDWPESGPVTMDLEQQRGPEDDGEAAERAFEALRAEVAALQLTSSEITQQVAAGVRRASDEATRGHAEAGAHLNAAVRDLRALIGAANEQFRQQRREWIAVAIGAVLGFLRLVSAGVAHPVRSGRWLAASLIGGGQWSAGATLMREEAPESWERMVPLYKACGEQSTETCEEAMVGRAIPPKVTAPESPVPPRNSGEAQ